MVFSTTPFGRRPGEGQGGALRQLLRREAPRRLLWLPVALAIGIGVYFALPEEPPAFLGPAVTALAITIAVAVRGWAVAAWIALLVVAAAMGFSVAEARTRSLGTVMLQAPIWADVEGRVLAIERRPTDRRVTLADAVVSATPNSLDRPTGVRVTIAGTRPASIDRVRIGDRVRLRARLQPPPPPVAPGAFDFQRHAFFQGIGAVGFAVGPVEIVDPVAISSYVRLHAAVNRTRDAVASRIRAVLVGPSGAVAAAMLVGDRAGIDSETSTTFRDTGLAHLLAISGLHMGLFAGTVFMAVRLAMAAIPGIVLRRPVKKLAAAVALATGFLYLILAGAPVPTQRAFLMTGLVLTAVLLDRDAVSLHLVAWAAAAVLLLAPESLIGPSFQLSFAAVTGLIAVWEGYVRYRRHTPRERSSGVGRRLMDYVAGVAATSAVASLVTAPVVAHHFQQVPVLGAVANLAAVPLTAFVTMPAGVAALVAMPVGLDTWPLVVMGAGIDATVWVADRVADGPLTALGVAAMGTVPLVLIALGGLWTAIWRTRIRWAGGLLVAAGLAAWAIERPPDVLIAADGALAAVNLPGDRGWAVSRDRGEGFLRSAWQRMWGGEAATNFLSAGRDETASGFLCDGLGCVLEVDGRMLAIPATAEAAAEDCARAQIVVTAVPIRSACPAAAAVIDRDSLRRGGAHAVWLLPDRIRIRSVAAERGRRPWVVNADR